MKIFAHRGNLSGPNPADENKPEYLQKALDSGYGVEVDVWLEDNKLYSGHDDTHRYEITKEFLIDDRILVHCKNIESFKYLNKFSNIHCFFQESEFVVLTSKGFLLYHELAYRSHPADKKDILVDLSSMNHSANDKPYGMITDVANFFAEPEQRSCFKLLILDVDGVLTNGKKTYDKEHNVLSKEFCDRDFTAIKRFASAGIPTILLSGDLFNSGMIDKRKELDFVYAREYSNQLDKSPAIEVIAKSQKVNLEEICYVGDDYYDLSALNVVGYPYCPADAADIVKQNATVLNKKGGEGAIEALYELVKDKLNQRYPYE